MGFLSKIRAFLLMEPEKEKQKKLKIISDLQDFKEDLTWARQILRNGRIWWKKAYLLTIMSWIFMGLSQLFSVENLLKTVLMFCGISCLALTSLIYWVVLSGK